MDPNQETGTQAAQSWETALQIALFSQAMPQVTGSPEQPRGRPAARSGTRRRRSLSESAADTRPQQRQRTADANRDAPHQQSPGQDQHIGDWQDEAYDLNHPVEQFRQDFQREAPQLEEDGEQGSRYIEWAERNRRRAAATERLRPSLFSSWLKSQAVPDTQQMCQQCGRQAAAVACSTCSEFHKQLLCGACDHARHPHAHTHARSVWADGYWKAIRADEEYSDTEQRCATVAKPIHSPPLACEDCGHSDNWGAPQAERAVNVLMCGLHKFHLAKYSCSCGHSQSQALPDLQPAGFWGATSTDKVETLVHEKLLAEWHMHKHQNPSAGLLGFLQAKDKLAEGYGAVPGLASRRAAVQVCYLEYRYREFDTRKHLLHLDALVCPLCHGGCRFPHVDGNMKNFNHHRPENPKEPDRRPYHDHVFLAADDAVQAHLQACDQVLGEQSRKVAPECRGLFKAARDVPFRAIGMWYSGRIVAVCRHGCPIMGCNLIQSGERYAYLNYVITELLSEDPERSKYIYLDIACRYAAWTDRLLQQLPGQPDEAVPAAFRARIMDTAEAHRQAIFLLGDMHIKAHAVACQVLHGAGLYPEIGAGAGEYAEQYFSFMSRLAAALRDASNAGTVDALTEAALQYCLDKEADIPETLRLRKGRLLAAKQKALEARDEVLADLQRTPEQLNFEQLQAAIIDISEDQHQRRQRHVPELIEFFKLHMRVRDSGVLGTFVADTAASEQHFLEACHFMATDERADMYTMHNSAASICGDRQRMMARRQVLYERLRADEALSEIAGQNVDAFGFSAIPTVADMHIRILQDEVEATVAAYRRTLIRVQLGALEAADRGKRDASLSSDMTRIRKAVDKVQLLRPYCSSPEQHVYDDRAIEQIMEARFPWMASLADERLQGLRMYDAARVVDRHQRYLRMCAEPAELGRQAQQADLCWAAQLQSSSGRVQQYTAVLAEPGALDAERPVTEFKRYQVAEAELMMDPGLLRGAMALENKLSAYVSQLRQAATASMA